MLRLEVRTSDKSLNRKRIAFNAPSYRIVYRLSSSQDFVWSFTKALNHQRVKTHKPRSITSQPLKPNTKENPNQTSHIIPRTINPADCTSYQKDIVLLYAWLTVTTSTCKLVHSHLLHKRIFTITLLSDTHPYIHALTHFPAYCNKKEVWLENWRWICNFIPLNVWTHIERCNILCQSKVYYSTCLLGGERGHKSRRYIHSLYSKRIIRTFLPLYRSMSP